MKYKIGTILAKYLEFRGKTVDGKKYTIRNPLVILKKKGTIKLTNGAEFTFNKYNKKYVLSVIYFALNEGIEFGNEKYQWKFDQKKGLSKRIRASNLRWKV